MFYDGWQRPIIVEEDSPAIYVVDESDPGHVKRVARRSYLAGFGGVGESVQSAILSALEAVLPLPTLYGATEEEQIVYGAQLTHDILVSRGGDPDGMSQDSPPQVVKGVQAMATDSLMSKMASILTNATSAAAAAKEVAPIVTLQLTPDEMVSTLSWCWAASADPFVIDAYESGAAAAVTQAGIIMPAEYAVDRRRRLFVFRLIKMMDDRNLWRGAGSTAGFGIVWEELAVTALWGLLVAFVVLGIVYLVGGSIERNAEYKAMCVNPDTRLPPEDRAKLCKVTDPTQSIADAATKVGYALAAGLLIYAFVVYGLPTLSERKAAQQRAFGQ